MLFPLNKILHSIFILLCIVTPSFVFSEPELNLIADKINISKNNQQIIASGNVKIIAGERQLLSKKIVYDRRTKQVIVYGPLQILDNGNIKIFAQSSVVSADLKASISKGVRALFEDSFQISSQEIQHKPSGETLFTNSMGTSCKICEKDKSPPIWNIKSKSIVHNQKEKSLVFRNAWLELGGVPVFYTPYIKTPEPGVTRASGLLTPSIISSDLLGFGIKQPFFFVLTPNSDITVSLLKTNQTNLIESELRAFFSDAQVELTGAIEPILSKEKFEGFIHTKGFKRLPGKILLNYDVTLLTNRDFLMKYGYRDTDLIANDISFTKFANYRADKLQAYYFQSLRTPTEKEPLVFPYFSSKSVQPLAYNLGILSQDTSLLGLIEAKKKFLRFNQTVNFDSKKTLENGLYFGALATLSGSFYNIWHDYDKSSQHLILHPVLSTDLSFPMMRKSIRGKEIINPKIQLTYSPVQKISDQTNEDSIQVDFDRTNLFSTNRFPGKDRQESGLWLNSSVQYLNESNTNRSLGAEIGQIFRLAEFNQFSPLSGLKGRRSDLLISGFFEYSDFVRASNSLLMNNKLQLRRSETNLSFTSARTSLSGNLLYSAFIENAPQEKQITELTIAGSQQINNNWKSVFDVRHDIASNQTISTSAGLIFENECVDFSFNLSKRFGSSNHLPEDTRFEISFDLGGFGQTRKNSAICDRKLNL